MIRVQYIISFLVLVLIQVFVLNQVLFMGYMNPYVYVLFILMLPANVSRSTVMLLAFLMGLCIDMFENSGGVHIAATVLLAYIRLPLLAIATQKRGDDFIQIRPSRLNLPNLMIYLILSIIIHHFTLFLIESYSLFDLGTVLLRTVLSSMFTFVFIMLAQLWNFRKKDRT